MSGDPNGRPIGWDEVEQLFSGFRFTAFRLETLQTYDAQHESEPFRQFLALGEAEITEELTGWGAELQAGIAAGRRYDRVHVVTEPLTDYVRFECAWGYPHNVTAGENIRILPVRDGDWPDGLPHLDFWLFDSHRLLWMNYAEDSSLVSTELVDDPEWVVAANVWRDHAMQRSIPFAEYENRFDSFARSH
ncbi:DUF6879 family protein [Allosalinactinospora lopnorensis]|uniref:DUF6879 family protein n=1 Tax=Allosalinactinospora lopnorensis TaxID=1352348 RepID=UPI0006976059|nr:DUF6879 family protein [Allosalinactinospora lopnorensis]